MPDLVISIFSLQNDRGLFVPEFNAYYVEKETGFEWSISCGGTRAYFIRTGSELGSDFEAECADSHFMANRIVTALFLGGLGLFRHEAVGRVILKDIVLNELTYYPHFDSRDLERDENNQEIKQLIDWYKFICMNNLFRRAVDDAYFALLNPVEASFYIYRGMEWLLKAGNIDWSELADDIGIPLKDLKNFKREVNNEFGQRHGISSGRKLRAHIRQYGTLVADFLYGMCNVRKRVDKHYEVPSPKDVSDIVMKALPMVPYL